MVLSVASGETPGKIAILSVVLIICGWIFQSITKINAFTFVALVGFFFLFISFLYYCVNIYDVGGNYRVVSILMLFIPIVPWIVFTNKLGMAGLLGEFVGVFLICWLFVFIMHLLKHVIGKTVLKKQKYSQFPPAKFYVVASTLFFFMFGFYIAILHNFLIS